MRISLGTKIFALATGIVLLMCAAAVMALHASSLVTRQLDGVVERNIPAYGALARAHIRSLEQALALRRAVLAPLGYGEVPADRHLEQFAQLDEQLTGELASAAAALAALGADAPPGAMRDLARLEARIQSLESDRVPYRREVGLLVAALRAGDRVEQQQELARIELLRDQLGERLEGIRRDMLQLLVTAARETRERQQAANTIMLALVALAAVLGLIGAGALTVRLLRSVRALVSGAEAVQLGKLDVTLEVRSHDEIGRLTSIFNGMVEGLRARNQLRELFGKYVDPRIVGQLVDRPLLMGEGGERRLLTALFCDIRGFTGLSEELTPSALVRLLNRYLTIMAEPVHDQRGVIDKFIGDAIMAYWAPPFVEEGRQAALACEAALAMAGGKLAQARGELPELLGVKKDVPSLDIRLGIATGQGVVGNVGSEDFRNYTVLGDPVNLASRLENAGKVYGTTILVCERTAALAGAAFAFRELDTVVLPGKTEPERIFELLGREGEIAETRLRLVQRYGAGLAAYRRGDWQAARAAFGEALAGDPVDGPTRCLLERVDALSHQPPDAAWSAVWTLREK